jgi:hypothetical protein
MSGQVEVAVEGLELSLVSDDEDVWLRDSRGFDIESRTNELSIGRPDLVAELFIRWLESHGYDVMEVPF